MSALILTRLLAGTCAERFAVERAATFCERDEWLTDDSLALAYKRLRNTSSQVAPDSVFLLE
eukprot:6814211-Alexandrium_andersonii.AAC.1